MGWRVDVTVGRVSSFIGERDSIVGLGCKHLTRPTKRLYAFCAVPDERRFKHLRQTIEMDTLVHIST